MTLPTLLLPGTLCDARLWRHQSAHLADLADVRVGDIATYDTVGATAEALLNDAPDQFGLVGFSLGGIVALEMARLAPERIVRLALLNVTARPLAPEQVTYWRTLGTQATATSFQPIAESLLPPMLADEHQQDEEMVGMLKQMAYEIGALRFLKQVGMQLSRRDLRPVLPSLDVPTLVVAAREDRTCPIECQQEIVAGMPHAQFVVIERCGHLSPIEQPEAVTDLLRCWLDVDTLAT